jgi:hypothetical protein
MALEFDGAPSPLEVGLEAFQPRFEARTHRFGRLGRLDVGAVDHQRAIAVLENVDGCKVVFEGNSLDDPVLEAPQLGVVRDDASSSSPPPTIVQAREPPLADDEQKRECDGDG